jgi:hypothetical protein
MSDRARAYVSELGPQEVTRTEKLVMAAIAEEYRDRYGSANLPAEDICEYAMISKRQLRRIMARLQSKGLVKYTPGVGNGVYSSFVLMNLPIGPQEVTGIEVGKNLEKGHKEDTKRTFRKPLIRKEDQNQNQIQNLKGFDSDVPPSSGGIFSPSSSKKPEPHDDIDANPLDVQQVINAYERSPVTKGKANKSDISTARRFLDRKGLAYSSQQIERGILLASARKMGSDQSNGVTARVQSLAYFENAIAEAANDKNLTDTYEEHLRRTIARFLKKPQGVVSS